MGGVYIKEFKFGKCKRFVMVLAPGSHPPYIKLI